MLSDVISVRLPRFVTPHVLSRIRAAIASAIPD